MHIYYVQRLSVSKVIEVSQVLPHSISKRFCEWTKIRILGNVQIYFLYWADFL